MKSYRCIVTGQVQGVYYRRSVQVQALKKEFSGYVRNLPDGSVEACVSCKETRLTEFLAILHAGSDISRVDSVDTKEIDERFEGNFEVR